MIIIKYIHNYMLILSHQVTKMQDVKKLKVYQVSSELSIDICNAIKNSRQFRLKEQIMASSTSIPSNLGEFAGMNKISQQAEKLRTVVREANETEERLKVFHKIGELSDEQQPDNRPGKEAPVRAGRRSNRAGRGQ